MGVTVHGDHIVALLQYVASVSGHIVGSHVLRVKCDGDRLGRSRLQHLCLLEINQVGSRFLDAAVYVRRIVVDFHHVLACHVSCVRNRHVKGDRAVIYCEITHLLCKCGVGQAIAEGVLYGRVIIDRALVIRCLIIFIAYINAFHIVCKGRIIGLCCSCVHALHGHIFHIGIMGCFPVVPPRRCCHIIDKGI